MGGPREGRILACVAVSESSAPGAGFQEFAPARKVMGGRLGCGFTPNREDLTVSVHQAQGQERGAARRVGAAGSRIPAFREEPLVPGAAGRAPPGDRVAAAARCTDVCCPHVATASIAPVLGGPLPLGLPWVYSGVEGRSDAAKPALDPEGLSLWPGAACWRAPRQRTVLPMAGVALLSPHCHPGIREK